MSRVRYQKKVITIAAGFSPGIDSHDVALDRGYSRITGIIAHEIKDGGIGYYDIGLRDDYKTFHDSTHKNDWKPNDMERYKPVEIENHGNNFYVDIVIPESTVSEIQIEVVFRLED